MRLIEGDLSKISEGAAHFIAEETLQHGVVVLRNQNLTPDEAVSYTHLTLPTNREV